MFKILIIVHEDGERLPCIVDQEDMPLVMANEYLIKRRGLAWSTLKRYANILMIIAEWEALNFNLYEKIRSGKLITEAEISGSLLPFLRRDFSKGKSVKRLVVENDTFNDRVWLLNRYLKTLYTKKLFSYMATDNEYLVTQSASELIFKLIKESKLPTSGKARTFKGLTESQVDSLLEIISPDSDQNPFDLCYVRKRNYLIVMLMLLFGLRPSEVLGLKVDDIEFGAVNAIHVIRRPNDPEDTRVEAPEVKRMGRTFILEGDEFILKVNDYIEEDREVLIEAHPDKETDFLFYSQHGTPMCTRTISKVFETIRNTFPDKFPRSFSAKSLRHTFTSSLEKNMRDAGVEKGERQKVLQYFRGDQSLDSQDVYLNDATIAEAKKFSKSHQRQIFTIEELACF